jgi:outer membrane receptor protein involved in Fe transport
MLSLKVENGFLVAARSPRSQVDQTVSLLPIPVSVLRRARFRAWRARVRAEITPGLQRRGRSPSATLALAGTLLLNLVIGVPTALAVSPQGPDLLELPFEELLEVEIRSAGKRDEEIREIPASVTILTRDEIARYGWITFEELLRNVPGFYLLDNTEDRFIGTRGAVGGGVQLLVNGIAQHPSLQKTITGTEIARLDIPVESIDRVEIIRGPMSVIYGNNAFQGVINVVTNAIEGSGPRASVSLGTGESGRLFGRVGRVFDEGFIVLNAGGYRTEGLTGAYADMLGPAQLAALIPGTHPDMDGDLDQRWGSLDLSAGWRGWEGSLRLNRRDYGIYAFTPPFDEGTRIRLDTLHASLGYAHRFSDDLGVRITGIYSAESYDAYQLDFVLPALEGDQRQDSRRAELEVDLHWRPTATVDTIAGYRLLRIDGVENRVYAPPLLVARDKLEPVTTHDLFAQSSWQVTAPLRLVGGVRISFLPDEYERIRRLGTDGVPVAESVPVGATAPVNGQVALLWTPTPDQVLKLAWGTASQDSDQFNLPEAERIETLEANYTLTRSRWMLTAGLFQNRLSQLVRTIQQLDPRTGIYTSLDDNSGRWRTRGLELIAEAQPLQALHLSASLTAQQTEDLETGIDPGYSPTLLATLKADWRRGPMTYAAYARYVDGMEADWDFVAGPEQGAVARIGEAVAGYWDLGVNLRWAPGATGPYAALNISNLLDTEIRYPANELTDFDRGLIGPGRVITATVGWAF